MNGNDHLPARDDLPENPDEFAGEEVAPEYDDSEVE